MYGLRWEHIEVMPFGELNRHLDHAQRFLQIAARSGGG